MNEQQIECDHPDTEAVEVQVPGGIWEPNTEMREMCIECEEILEPREPDDFDRSDEVWEAEHGY